MLVFGLFILFVTNSISGILVVQSRTMIKDRFIGNKDSRLR